MFTEKIASLWDQLKVVFSDFAFTDFLDICLVAFILYSVIKLIRETKAIQLAKGLLLFGVAYLAIYLLDMQASEFIFKKVFGEIIIVLVILFQPELRRALERVGAQLHFHLLSTEPTASIEQGAVNATVQACEIMSRERVGVLLVFERETPLDEYFKTGTIVDAQLSEQLLRNLFFKNSPLHDGAVIVRGGRAGVGTSEASDAVVVIVSEENGTISVAIGGMLKRHLAPQTLQKLLSNELIADETEKKSLFKKLAASLTRKDGPK